MKIIANFYLYNSKKENIEYDRNITLTTIIIEANKFIKEVDKNIDFEQLVTKWSDLKIFLEKYGDIPLFKLLKIEKKFKICYGGYIRFKVLYDNIEQFISFKSKNKINNTNKVYLIYNYIIKFLSNEDIINLSLVSKDSYNLIKNYKILNLDIVLKNNCDKKGQKEEKLINFNKFFGGPSYNLYEVKKLGMFIGKKYFYILIQSIETYNVEIMRFDKNDIDKHEVIFRDEWTNYYMFDNVIYQLKYNKGKAKLNKIDKKEDEIELISINVSNLGDNFDSEYFYNFKEKNEIYIISSELKIYKLNNKKRKLKLFFDESKKYQSFKKFAKECKIRQYHKYYIFIKEIFFLSLKEFFIYDINDKKQIKCYPEIRGVELVEKIKSFYYILDYRNCYLLSEKDFEINYQFKKYHNDLSMNQLLIVDPFLNDMQISVNDFIYKDIDLKDGEIDKKIKIKNFLLKLGDNYFCSNYYNDETALYIKLLKINKNNISENISSIRQIRINMSKFIKKIKFEEGIKEKTKKEIIKNIKCHLFFNGQNDIIINVNEFFWIYHYNDSMENEDYNDKNQNNKIIFENKYPKVLIKYDKISVKTNEIIRYHNIIFYDNIFIVWKQKSLKIIYFNLNKNTLNKKEKEEENKSKNTKILLLEDIEDESKDIYVETPIFLFNSFHKLFLISSFSEENNSFDLFELKIENNKINLIKYYIIELKKEEKNKNDEIIMYANLINEQKYLVIFTSYSIILFAKDNSEDNIYKQIKRKEHYIIGYFKVRQLYEEETCFVVQDDRTKKCLLFDVFSWFQNK